MPKTNCCDEQKDKKTRESKKSSSHTSVKCNVSEKALDCCSLPYQRLDKLRNMWTLVSSNLVSGKQDVTSCGYFEDVHNRAGERVKVPDADAFGGECHGAIPLACVEDEHAKPAHHLDNAYFAYLFVNSMRYQAFEACGKHDQVVGWLVDTQSGNLELFQDLPEDNLYMNTTLVSLTDKTSEDLVYNDKAKLYQLTVLYKLTLKAIEKVCGNPKEEGNVVVVCDKRDRKWMVCINRADSDANVASLCQRFVVVAVQL